MTPVKTHYSKVGRPTDTTEPRYSPRAGTGGKNLGRQRPSLTGDADTLVSVGVPMSGAEWYEGADTLLCRHCYMTANFKPHYKPVRGPLPDLTGDSYCESCGSHPCRWCGTGIVPPGERYCARHADFCALCNGGGEVGGDPNYEAPQTCPDCGGKGRVTA